jgi:hypothetical protein
MRGLDPRIQHFRKMMDCRVKSGNDEKSSPVVICAEPAHNASSVMQNARRSRIGECS